MEITIQPYAEEFKTSCLNIIRKVVIDGFIESGVDIQKEPGHLERELINQENRIHAIPKQYYVATQDTQVVGMIAYLDPSEPVQIVAKQLQIPIDQIREIIAVYVHPDFQRKGVGSELLTHMGNVLRDKKIPYFALSTGYLRGKNFWRKKLGNETQILQTYYEGHPCHVWIRNVDDIL